MEHSITLLYRNRNLNNVQLQHVETFENLSPSSNPDAASLKITRAAVKLVLPPAEKCKILACSCIYFKSAIKKCLICPSVDTDSLPRRLTGYSISDKRYLPHMLRT